MGKHKRQLRNFLINRDYQLRYTLIMVFICTALTATLGYSWYGQMRIASDLVEVGALGSKSETYAYEVKDKLAAHDRMRMMILVGFGVTLCLAIALFGILLTHKVAGPLKYIGSILNQMAAGRLGTLRDLRSGDQLVGFFELFKRAHDSLREETEQDLETLDQVITAAEEAADGPLADQLEALRQLRQRKATRLGQG